MKCAGVAAGKVWGREDSCGHYGAPSNGHVLLRRILRDLKLQVAYMFISLSGLFCKELPFNCWQAVRPPTQLKALLDCPIFTLHEHKLFYGLLM